MTSLDLTCCVCLEELVAPISLGCGHNIDIRCFAQLKDRGGTKTCPMCRWEFNNSDSYGINMVLAQLLKQHNPKYDSMERDHTRFVKSIKIFDKYRKSSRFKKLKKLVYSYLEAEQQTEKLAALIPVMADKFDTPGEKLKLELFYLFDQDEFIFKEEFGDETYAVLIDDGDMDSIETIIMKHKETIGHDTVLKYISLSTGLADNIISIMGINVAHKAFLLDEDMDKLIDHLLTYNDNYPVPFNESESDSESESEPDPGVDFSDSDSDSDPF